MKTENLTKSLKPTSQTAPFRLLIVACVAGLALPILLPLLCNALLPPADAAVSKTFYFDTVGKIITVCGAGGGAGVVIGSLFKTGGKVAAQLATGVVTEATPKGEGITAYAPFTGTPDDLLDEAPIA